MSIKEENNDALDVQILSGETADILKNITKQELLGLGVHDVAYIRPIMVEGREQYAIHAADGTELSIMESINTALGTIIQNDLEAVTVH